MLLTFIYDIWLSKLYFSTDCRHTKLFTTIFFHKITSSAKPSTSSPGTKTTVGENPLDQAAACGLHPYWSSHSRSLGLLNQGYINYHIARTLVRAEFLVWTLNGKSFSQETATIRSYKAETLHIRGRILTVLSSQV